MKKLVAIIVILCSLAIASYALVPNLTTVKHTASEQCVILLHGMSRNTFSMKKVAGYLHHQHYSVVNYGYPSTGEAGIPELAETEVPNAIKQCPENSHHIHFVTHSLGGIIVRQYLQNNQLPPGSRIIMLAPPNHGSEITDHLRDTWYYQLATGQPGQELGTRDMDIPNSLQPISYEVGVIAGDISYEPWFSKLMPGSDDGKVSVESTKLTEMDDFIIVPTSHTFIMRHPDVLIQIDNFLQYGRFVH